MTVRAVLLSGLLTLAACFGAAAQTEETPSAVTPAGTVSWSFSGPFGTYDRAQLRRGLTVYQGICRSCHGMKYLAFRQLSEPGGPELTDEEMRAVAATFMFPAVDESGEATEREGKPADKFRSPYANDVLAALSNSGTIPPDLTLMAKARTLERPFSRSLVNLVTLNTESGADYIHALLTGYRDPPEDFTGVAYNLVYPKNATAMAQPFFDDQFDYPAGPDGNPEAPQTVDQYAQDVAAFLTWASDPRMEERKSLGWKVLLYLALLAGLLILCKKAVWAGADRELRDGSGGEA
ncbi:MAG: cytochrome c1 [Methylobacteriaceae bacterium]|jgi:cytochrome c1|nr:cytochrome c1 [Methylobacteriaceae bacterium]